MKNIVKITIESYLIMIALTRTLPEIISIQSFESTIDYMTALIYSILGEYKLTDVFIFVAIYLLLYKIKQDINRSYRVTALLFSSILVVGESIDAIGTFELIVGSPSNIIIASSKFLGFYFLFQYLIQIMMKYMKQLKVDRTAVEYLNPCMKWFDEKCWQKVFFILISFWGILLIINYPGNLCWDVIGQIEQVIFNTGYSSHHPLFHTLLVGGCIELGNLFLNSYEIGLFIYMILQISFFASSLAFTIYYLNKKKLNQFIILSVLLVYLIAPIYSNLATTAIKDIPFISSFIFFFVYFVDYYGSKEEKILKNHVIYLSVFSILTCLFRNNGLYMIVLTYIIYLIIAIVKRNRLVFINTAKLCAILVVSYCVIQTILVTALGATAGSSREIFSLPFQLTARYLQLYHEEITVDEEIIIENILGDIDAVRGAYNPEIADPVKNLYLDDSVTTIDLVKYLQVFVTQFFKHPRVYIEGFLIHVNGWFNPSISNSIRYEVEYDIINTQGIVSGTSKIVLFFYRFLERITPIALLETPGFYTWLLVLVTVFKRESKQDIIILLPQWIGLFICMISPCFLLHPRYALPIMFTMPFIIGYSLCLRKE
ncbi:MAG: DUF6020 family protein [Lachnospiraceae bacterium]